MTFEPIENWWTLIKGAFNVVIHNSILSVPIAVTIILYATDVLKEIFKLLKKGN